MAYNFCFLTHVSLFSLQSDLAEFLYQQQCNFLQYRKAIALFHSLVIIKSLFIYRMESSIYIYPSCY